MKKRMSSNLIDVFVCVLFMSITAYSTVAVKMYSFEDALNTSNVSKPRIYIQNTGTEAISNVTYNYYFQTENSKIPVLDDYYTPNEDVTLVADGAMKYHIKYTLTSTLQPGQIIPGSPGNSIGLHFNSWDFWDKTNDSSNNRSGSFLENQKISVYVNNVKIYPNEPGGGTPPPESAPVQLQSFALYSTLGTYIRDRSQFVGGGAVGSNGLVEVNSGAIVWGNVISHANVILHSTSVINGSVFSSGTVTRDAGSIVTDSVYEHTSVNVLTIPIKTITAGSTDKTILTNQIITVSPGIYRNLTVQSNGTVKFAPGNYTFNSFTLDLGAHVIFDVTMNQNLEINIAGDLAVGNNATMQFSGKGYAPAVKIYTNDQNTISIGTDTKITGIIYAPNALISMYSRAKCDGAIYAKQITVEPDALVSSGLVDPDGDADRDGVPNYIEVQTGTDPTDSTSYKMMASPRPAAINNSISNVVTYNLSNFYEDYYKDDVMTLKIPANGLQPGKVNALANVNNNPVDFNGAAVSGFTLPADYSLASRFVSFEPTAFSPTANIEIDLPVNDENSAAADNYSVYYHSTAGWAMAEASLTYVATPIFIRPVLPILTIKVLAPDIVVVVKKHSVTTAYFDEGLIATNGFAAIGMDLAILDVPYNASATLTIDYKDFGQSANPPTSSYSTGLLNVQDPESGKYDLVFSADPLLESAGKIQISHISLFSSIAGVSYSQNYLYEILPGQKAKLVAHKNAFLMNKDLSSLAWEWIDNNSSVTLDIAGEGRIRRSGAGFSYDYFLKDHLGSTREVINEEDGTVSEATMYYPYGTMVPLQAPAPGDDSKEKFTGKEFDANGVVNGVGGIDAYYFEARMYDPEIGTFTSIDPAEQFYNSYRYTTNPIGFVDPSGTYDFGIYQGPYPLVQPITYQTNYGSSFFPSLAKDIGGFLYSGIGGTVNFVSSSLGSISNTFGLTYVNAGLNSGAAFVIGNTIGKVPEPVWTVIDDAGTAAMSLEGLGVIPKEIAIAGRAARELEEGGVIAGEAGRFAELDARAIVGDALTPHHMPQAALNFTSRAEGGALVLPKSEHVLTRTYGISGAKTAITEAGMPFRNVLARDILDVKKLTGSTYNSGLQDLLLYYRTDFPQLLRK